MADRDVVILVEGLGKKYIIQHEQPHRHGTVRDAISQQVSSLAKWANPFTLPGQIQRARRHAQHEQRSGKEDFWALKDVSFEIRRGERVGIIGRNGAGKSTLLKILSRITEPTTGRVEIRGRVASLLEVGTGFHPELTGRENIFLNGAILGMTRREIRSKFDEIVDFAEVEKFLDTPVKRYSSGMYVRLAFAVAAHLEPEILVVDEVLAVGDAIFQKKCLGKMEDVAEREGRTILFVSHQMAAIQKICKTGLFLLKGSVHTYGLTQVAIGAYMASMIGCENLLKIEEENRIGSGLIRITRILFRSADKQQIQSAICGQDLIVDLHYTTSGTHPVDLSGLICSLQFKDHLGDPIFLTHNRMTGDKFIDYSAKGFFRLTLKKLPLPQAIYLISYTLIIDGEYIDAVDSALRFQVEAGDFYGTGEIPPSTHGKIIVESSWSHEAAGEAFAAS